MHASRAQFVQISCEDLLGGGATVSECNKLTVNASRAGGFLLDAMNGTLLGGLSSFHLPLSPGESVPGNTRSMRE